MTIVTMSITAMDTMKIPVGINADYEPVMETVHVHYSALIDAKDDDGVIESAQIITVYDDNKKVIATSEDELIAARDGEFAGNVLWIIKCKLRALAFPNEA